MSRFIVNDLPLTGLKRIERQPLRDNRGFLTRLFCAEDLRIAGWANPIAQINHTMTAQKGAVRGMHFQHPPHMEMKLVSCIRGEVWDVAVDLRRDSETYLKWHAERLSAENECALLIPEGFAHGFQALTQNAELIYCHSSAYNPDAEDGLNPKDPALKVDWPLEIIEMSARDAGHSMLSADFSGLVV